MVAACGPAIDTDDGAGTGDDGDSSSGSGTSATTTTASSTTATTTIGTTDGTTTTTTTTGPAPGCAEDYVIGCQSYCAASLTCDPGPDGAYEECVNGCIGEIPEGDVPCQVALCEAFACFGALDCATLDAGAPECEAMLEANGECLTGDDCFYGGSSEGECEYGCSGEVDRSLRCNVEVCTCYENDVPGESCPADGVCKDFEQLDELAVFCCGW